MTLSTREGAVCVCLSVRKMVCVCVCTSRMHPSATYDCVSKLPMGKGGSIWLTKDICGMSFLGDGL